MPMIIHVFADTPHHYYPMREFFLNTCAVDKTQKFWVKKLVNEAIDPSLTYYSDASDLVSKLKTLSDSTQIVFHGLFDIHVWKLLMFSNILKRCHCVFWGAELYRHGKPQRTLKDRIAQVIHGVFINRLNNVFALNSGDAVLAQKLLMRRHVKVLPYPIIGVENNINTKLWDVEPSVFKLLVGNSAAASNNHFEALKALSHFSDENIEIIVPLSYAGTPDYIKKVIEYGHELFGDKFLPITDMMAKEKFDNLLAEMNACIFAHDRQQGLYAVYAMFLMGKSVFLKQATTSFENFNQQRFTVNSFETLSEMSFTNFSELVKENDHYNSQLMKTHYTESALSPKWSKMLSTIC